MRLSFFLLSIALPLWPADGDQRFADLGDFPLTSGEAIRNCRLGYRTLGKLNEARSNAIVWPTWFGGQSENLLPFIGADKAIDPGRFFVVLVDALGNGVSSSPSNGQKPFPRFTPRDMVNSQHALLTRHLGIQHLHAVVGISMGGMQTFEWITAYPGFMDRAVPIIGSPRLAALWGAQLGVIELAESSGADKRAAMRVVMSMHQYALQTPEFRAAATPAAEWGKYKQTFEAGAGERVSAEDWASQLRAMMATNAGPPESVKAKILVVVATQDHMVNPNPAIQFAERIYAPILRLEGNCGHLATSCEAAKFTGAVRRFLE
jgi:homoserine O-acetyltransferase/O-succinyltransferase